MRIKHSQNNLKLHNNGIILCIMSRKFDEKIAILFIGITRYTINYIIPWSSRFKNECNAGIIP